MDSGEAVLPKSREQVPVVNLSGRTGQRVEYVPWDAAGATQLQGPRRRVEAAGRIKK